MSQQDHASKSKPRFPVFLARGASLFFVFIDILAGQVPEDPEVPGTIGQGQFNLHAVVVGIGEKTVLRDVLDG